MPVGIAEVEADAAAFPLAAFFDGDGVDGEPGFPVGERRGGDGEGEVEVALATFPIVEPMPGPVSSSSAPIPQSRR